MLILTEFLKTYWKQFAIAGFVLFVFLFGYYKGYAHEQTKYEAHLASDARLTAIAIAENNQKIKAADKVNKDITKEYSDAIAKINAYYKSHPHIIKLCNGASSTSTVPSTSQSADTTATTSSGATEATTEIDLEKAGKEVTQCQLLIKFEQEQEGVQ